MIIALAGGVGGAKLVDGLARLLAPDDFMAVINTGDDFEHLRMQISPDLDTVMYTLAGRANPQTGWGLAGETWQCMASMKRVGGETWFQLGDQDLATHIRRTQLLALGATLTEATSLLCRAYGVLHPVVPMSDDPVRTIIDTDEGELAFQDYFVRRRCEPVARAVRYAGADKARLSTAFTAAIEDRRLRAIVVCPSNPYLSIGPMIAMPALLARLSAAPVPVIGVSPIVGGQAIKGPAAKMMRELGRGASAGEVARLYAPFVDGLVLDDTDASDAAVVESHGVQPFVTSTVMTNDTHRVQLARNVLKFASTLAPTRRPR